MKVPDKSQWKKLEPRLNPFLRYEFHAALRESGCIGEKAGWCEEFVVSDQGLLPCYLKNHSYGEFIFDWGWAEAYERHGLAYYPKLTSMVPFTPVTTSHFLMPQFDEAFASSLLKQQDQHYQELGVSSNHFLFLQSQERELFLEHNYLLRESVQYHFFNNDYANFDQYLTSLKPKKARNLIKERQFSQVSFHRYTGETLCPQHAHEMYRFYLSTIDKKNSFDYLNEDFFLRVIASMPENILYVQARLNDQPIAGSLFFFDEERLYGRYWGSIQFVPFLHFELCYYQGMDFCFEKKLKVFEAGAQGEHKIMRGFRPERTFSAHKIKNPVFSKAIGDFIQKEKIAIAEQIRILSELLPFKN